MPEKTMKTIYKMTLDFLTELRDHHGYTDVPILEHLIEHYGDEVQIEEALAKVKITQRL